MGDVTGRAVLRAIRLALRFAIGWLLNGLGFPGFIYDDAYVASISNTNVSVHRSPFFTVVTVNGLDIYFHRLTGKLDGVGFNPTSCSPRASIPGSVHLGAVPAAPPKPTRK